MKIKPKFLALLLGLVLVTATFSTMATGFGGHSETDIVMVSLEGENDVTSIENAGGDVLETYPKKALVEIPFGEEEKLTSNGIEISNELPARTEVSVKDHKFDINDGMPEFSDELTIDGYESGEEGTYLVHMIGPVHAEWREKLEARGIDILNYQPNYAYEVRMTPEWAERVEDLDFVDWVDIYHPGFKIDENVEPGVVSIEMIDGGRIISEVKDRSELVEIANDKDVYHISQYDEPELYDEMATQIIGGGLWVMDDDDDPDTAYRADGDYGSYANQIGYEGSGHVTAIADTGLGDGTTPDAGHEDFTGRVVGGYTYTDDDSWEDGDGHGTHCAGSVGGDTHNGQGDSYYEDYYAAQGSAPETELFSVRIFDGDGNFVAGEDYREIIDVALQNSDTYVHSNSWGGSGDSAYDDSDVAYDQAVRDGNRDSNENEPVVITVAAGNEGPGAQGGGYETIGSPGVAKNVITVGSTQNYNPNEDVDDPEAVSDFSSRGWTEDNRVKPDVMAPGEGIYSTDPEGGYQSMSGTSMANPAVAGASSVVVDWYEEQYGERPNPSMVKALLINNAYDLENTQSDTGENSPHIPNQDEGWGLVNLPSIVDAPVNMNLEDETSLLTTGDVDEYEIEYDDASVPLNITLTWTDDEAASGDADTLKNDLNLELVSPSGTVYRGNNLVESWSESGEATFDTFDDSGDGWDDSNNVENINLHTDDMETGTYTVRVHGFDVPEDANNDGNANQDYSLVMYNAVEATSDPGPLAPTDPDPADGDTGVATDVELSVYAEHEDGDNMDVSFYDASDDSEIGTDNNVQSGDRAYQTWEGLDYDTTYDWYAVADDGSQTATSATWNFTTTAATAPEITLTRPEGGETWNAGDDEEITWDTTEGDGAITGVDLEYTIDDGGTWTEIVSGTEDDGSYMWTVPDEPTDQARIRATVNDDNDLNDTDTSGQFTIEGTNPPEITITRPEGGEEWNAGDEEDINWDTTAGDGAITGVDLNYSVDGGASWTNIVTGTEDDGVYTWTVPDEPTEEAQIRGTVHDDNDLSHQNESALFTILGTSSAPPDYLNVEHDGTVNETEGLVTNGTFPDNYEPWALTELQADGISEWDGTTNYEEDGSIYSSVTQGANNAVSTQEAQWDQAIGPTTSTLTVNGAYNMDLNTEAGQASIDGTVEILVYDTGTEAWETIYTESNTGTVNTGWVEFGPDATYTPTGEVTDIRAYMFVEADGHNQGGASGDIWMDNISATIETTGEGTEDNLLTWGASPDEPDVVEYNVYRSEGWNETDPYQLIDTVSANESAEYEYVDPDRGTADDILWWYRIHAVDDQGQESNGTENVQEPGADNVTYTLDVSSTSGGNVTDPGEGTYEYDNGTDVSLEAVADEGYHFVEWTGDNGTISDTTANQTTITMEGDYSITAEFEINTYSLTIDSTAGGNVTDPGEGTFEYDHGTDVPLEAVADESYQFVEWTGDNGTISDTTANQTTMTMEGDYSITANFESTQVSDVYIYPDTDQTVSAGEEFTFDAEAYDQNGDLITDDPTDFTWENATDGVFYETNTGDYDVTATYDGVTSNITTVTVEPAEAESIELSPQTANITAGNSQAYNATAYDEWGNAFDVTDDTTWSDDVDPADRSSWTDNVITVEEAGEWNVTGEYENATGSLLTDVASLTVEPEDVDSVVIYPDTDQTVQAGEELLFDAEAYDVYGNLITDSADDFTWDNASNGVFYETTAGEYDVTATYNGVTSNITTVTVEPAAVDSVEISPSADQTVKTGEDLNFTAAAYDEYGNLITDDVTNFTWDNISSLDDQNNVAVFNEEETGDYNVTATHDGVTSNITTVTVESGEVSEVLIYPDTDQTISAGEELVFDAEAYDQDGNLITDDPTDFTWENATDGVFYETNTGDYDVTATYDGVTSNITTVTVEPAEAESIELSPQTANITAGESQAYNATAYDEWGNAFDVTDDTTWSDDVSAGNSSWTDNVITVEEAGDWTVTGEYENESGGLLTDTGSLTVEPGDVDDVVIYPEEDQVVQAGEELLFDAEAYDSYDNLITDNVDDFDWQNALNGYFNETTAGEYDVTATYDGVTSNITTVTVEPGEVDYVVLDPAEDQTIVTGEELEFTVEAFDEYDNLITDDVTNFTWENISDIDDQANVAIFSEQEAGDYNVTATYDGVISPATKVTVLPYTLTIDSTEGGNVSEPGEGTFEYDNGTVVDLEAIADEGYHFVEWTGDNGTIGDTTANQTTIEMLDNYTITAEFEINTYTLNVSSTAGGNVTDPGEGQFEYDHGDIVNLEAIADEGYHFVEWTGDNGTIADTLANDTEIEMLDDYTITANFAEEEAWDPVPVTGAWVEKDEEAGNLLVHWDDVGAPEYNVYYSQDQHTDWNNWNLTATVEETTFTHDGALDGDNFYIVRGSDGSEEGGNSTMAFCYEMPLTYDPDAPLHYVSIPNRFNNMDTVTASDIVEHIEGGTGEEHSDYIDAVVKWDYEARTYEEVYEHTTFGWTGDFEVEPNAAVGLRLVDNLTWHVNATDAEQEISLTYDSDAPLHYISIPYTADFEYASDIVESIEGGTGEEHSDYIDAVVKWDYEARTYEEVYEHTTFGWTGDFELEPNATVGLRLVDNLNWTPELITPVQETDTTTGDSLENTGEFVQTTEDFSISNHEGNLDAIVKNPSIGLRTDSNIQLNVKGGIYRRRVSD